MKPMKRGQDFKALKLNVLKNGETSHFIYIKEHSVREHSQDKPSGRTLFILNIPPYADEQGLSNAFSEVSNIESITFSISPSLNKDERKNRFLEETNKSAFKVAFIVFKKVSDLDKALKLQKLRPLCNENHNIISGMSKWINEYNKNIFTAKVLKEKIESFMVLHDKESKIIEEKEKQIEQQDEEGWVTVTKKGNIQSFPRSEKVETKIMAKEEMKKNKKELKNFYTFQIRESKMKHIVSLRQKFEEDKKKIALIKQSRRFKPF